MRNYRLFFITVLIAHCMYLAVLEQRERASDPGQPAADASPGRYQAVT